MVLAHGFVSEVFQVALVVRDLKATMAEYVDRMGIGPWRVMHFGPPRMTEMRLRGEPTSFSMDIAIAFTGDTMWELIEPVDGPSIYKEFLDEHGEGLHHVLVRHEGLDFDAAVARFGQAGCPPLMEGRLGEIRFAYVETEGPLKTTIELMDRPRDASPIEPDYWYPERESADV